MVGTGMMPSMQEYSKEQERLRNLIEKQQQVAKRLVSGYAASSQTLDSYSFVEKHG